MKRKFFIVAAIILFGLPVRAEQPKSLFYLTRDPKSVRSFLAHADKVDILVPAWYSVDSNGLVSGGPNPLVLETARQHHVPIMPIVVNNGFSQEDFHKLVMNRAAYETMSGSLRAACKENGYIGFQFDFENIHWTDRSALSSMVAYVASEFHSAKLQLTIATVPNAPGAPGEGGFSNWIYENWRGAYDLSALAQSVDLICLMTYDQHTRWTAPGPVAGWAWTTGNLDYALKFVPREKLSRIHRHRRRPGSRQGLRRPRRMGSRRPFRLVFLLSRRLARMDIFHRRPHVPRALYAGKRPRPAGILLLGSRG